MHLTHVRVRVVDEFGSGPLVSVSWPYGGGDRADRDGLLAIADRTKFRRDMSDPVRLRPVAENDGAPACMHEFKRPSSALGSGAEHG
jgi:hypothetical protein